MIFASAGLANPQLHIQIGEVLQRQLARIGVRVTLRPMELAAYYNKTYAYDYKMSHHIPLNNPDPDENLEAYFGETATFYRWGNKEIWGAIRAQSEELDEGRRIELVHRASRMIVLDYPMRFMFTPNNHFFIHPWVKNWQYPIDLYDGRKWSAWIDR